MTHVSLPLSDIRSFGVAPRPLPFRGRSLPQARSLLIVAVVGAGLASGAAVVGHSHHAPSVVADASPVSVATPPSEVASPTLATPDPGSAVGGAMIARRVDSLVFSPTPLYPTVDPTPHDKAPVVAGIPADAMRKLADKMAATMTSDVAPTPHARAAAPTPAAASVATADQATPMPIPAPRPVETRAPPPLPAMFRPAARPAPAGVLGYAPQPSVAPAPVDVAQAVPASPVRGPTSVAYAPQVQPAPADTPGIFDKLLGALRSLGTPSQGGGGAAGGGRYDRYTAVYDISAHTVYLPDGTRLEAHSGLGQLIDDPRFVHARNRGATPPHLYDLKPREQLFHGVQALRLTPVGSGDVYGRVGLLAHTYMLGRNGDSNGCVSFRDYKSFLAAYQRGEVRRLAVVERQA